MVSLNRPDYLLQPGAVIRRLRIPYSKPGTGQAVTVTPAWGLPLEARSDESIGYSLITTGVFDLPVTEALLRLTDPGELAVDVGANIGCMTGALASVAGEVWAFEPNPTVLPVLERAVARWGRRVKVHPVALSDKTGSTSFVVPLNPQNGGLARVGTDAHNQDTIVQVDTAPLDALVGDRQIGVLKIDTEGHEPAVLAGAARLIRERGARDLVYEDTAGYPSATSGPLVEAGYAVFALGRTFFGPRLDPPSRVTAGEEEQSYLATLDADRARARLKPRGWRCLR
jgi:FkbM family methyltransferase